LEIISIILQATNIQRCPNAGGLGYYAQLLSLSYISGLKAKGYYQLAAGYGTIGYEPEVNTFFGQPRSISTGGVAFDIPMIHIIQNQDGDAEKAKKFSLQVGTLGSALEHITPEQMLAPTDPNAPKPDAISAVKALQKASAAGQKIYKITKDNIDQVLPFLHHDQEARNDIIRGVNAGKEVTTHTDAVSIPGGWSGFGYIITDPVVGDGVYKISGGLNGGAMTLLEKAEMFFWSVFGVLEGVAPKLLSAMKAILDHVRNIIEIVSTCPMGIAIAAIISVTLILVGFLLLAPAFAALGVVAAVGFDIFGGVALAAVSAGWIRSCKP